MEEEKHPGPETAASAASLGSALDEIGFKRLGRRIRLSPGDRHPGLRVRVYPSPDNE
jgi:hypothetical protein